MDCVVVVAGVFTPGSVVRLFAVADESVLRVEGKDAVASRIVDGAGNVGFDGLEVGGRYFVEGYVAGSYTLVRVRGVDAAAPDSELQQAPIRAVPQPVGTQEAKIVDPAPAVPDESLETGIPVTAEAANPIVWNRESQLSPGLVAQATQLGVQFADRFTNDGGLRMAISRLGITPVA